MSCSISVPFLKCKHECLWLAIIIVTVITKAGVIQVTSELKFFETHKLGSALSCYLKKKMYLLFSVLPQIVGGACFLWFSLVTYITLL